MPEENGVADASSGLQSSVVAKLGCVGFTFYTGVFKVTKYIHEQLHYKSWQCIWREVVLYCLRKHLFDLGEIFSDNLWLTEAFAFVDISFKDLCLAACGLSSLLIVAHRAVLLYTTKHRWLRLLLCMTTGCLLYARCMEATWQQLLCVYLADITVRLAPWPTHTGPKTISGRKDTRFRKKRRS
jgi:hypothetical protein